MNQLRFRLVKYHRKLQLGKSIGNNHIFSKYYQDKQKLSRCVGPVRWTRDEIQIQEAQLVGADLYLIKKN